MVVVIDRVYSIAILANYGLPSGQVNRPITKKKYQLQCFHECGYILLISIYYVYSVVPINMLLHISYNIKPISCIPALTLLSDILLLIYI